MHSHSFSPYTLSRSTGQPGVGQGENDRSAHSSVVAPRIASAFPTFYGRELTDTDVGCNGWTIANKNTGVQRAPRELRPDVLSNPSSAGASTGQPGMSQPMDVDLSGGIGFSTTNTQNFVVNQTNILNESCVFGNVSNQAVANHTAVAVGATMQVAEERHSIVVNTHHYEMEDARQNARVAQETNKQLQELVLRLQDQANADSARVDRLSELEIAFDIQNNEIITLQREKEASAHSAQARASAWAAAHPVSSSSGEGNQFQELSSGGTGASQPGRLESLALTKNFLGYVKGAPSEPTTTCDTAGGHGGSESSVSDNRFLFPFDLTSHSQEKSLSRPVSPVNSERTAATEQSGPRHVSLTATQTVTAPTKTVQDDNRKPSPNKPGAASSSKDHANRKGRQEGQEGQEEG